MTNLTSVMDSNEIPIYPQAPSPRGICLIVNNQDIPNMRFRNGSELDVERVKGVFSAVGYDVNENYVKSDLSADQLIETMNFGICLMNLCTINYKIRIAKIFLM